MFAPTLASKLAPALASTLAPTVYTVHIAAYRTHIYSPYSSYTAVYSQPYTALYRVHIQFISGNPYTASTSHRHPYTVHIQSIYSLYIGHAHFIFQYTARHSCRFHPYSSLEAARSLYIYSAYTVHVDPYRSIYSAYTPYTSHIQSI
jgi:hypothetical protein